MGFPISALRMRNPSTASGPYGSHRYWRVYSTANDGHATQTGIAEVEFRGSVGGADLTGSGTPLSGGSGADVAGGAASQAFDNDTGQPWIRSATSGVWIGYDFGSAVAVAQVQLTAILIQPERNITAGSVDWSDDGSTWTTAFSFSIFAWTPSQNRTLPETTPTAGTYRSLRISIATNNGDARVGIAEIEFRASIGGADQATGGVAKASSSFSGFSPASAFADNGTGSQWLSNTLSSEWIRYDFLNPVSLVETMIQGYSSTTARSPKDFTIQGSNDGTTWTTLFSPASQTGWTAGQIRTFS